MAVLFFAQFVLHRRVPFMMDDLWYGTNLATGVPLGGLRDVLESQVWHFYNWGGRNITHGILQLTLMWGELPADILNVGMTMLLGYLACVLAGNRKPFWFLTAGVLMLALNANGKMSMFWQAGTVNYVYSTVWIFFFLWVFLRELQEEVKELPAASIWMIPLGLMTGWSNENMGPASFLLACGVTVYLVRVRKQKLCLWMLEGIVMSFVGSILVIVAPGNFVRSAAIEEKGLAEAVYDRFYSMLCASVEYLFPTLLLLAAIILVYKICLKGTIKPFQWALLSVVVLAHGAMILSPHYPDRATFGIMMVCIALMISFLTEIAEKNRRVVPYLVVAVGCLWMYAIYILGGYLYFAV